MAEIDDKQLASCIRWMERVGLRAKVFEEVSIQTLAEETANALRELELHRKDNPHDSRH